jgi:beta-aspartyl-peptidase (threonine type)
MTMPPAPPEWTLIVHGGAGIIDKSTVTAEQEALAIAGLSAALDAGAAVFDRGGSALDASEAAVCVLEDDPAFNAGRGAVFTWDGRNELDAAVMDGATRAAGAIAGVSSVRNPVRLARAVMAHSPHVLLSGAGAEIFARERGVELVDPSWFATDERRRQLERMKARPDWFDSDLKYGTVGAVAMAHGHVAAATSTGGLTGKRWGRIGDSPLIGAGTYADDRACAVSATGAGEYFIREGVAHEICARVRMLDETIQQAADAVLADTLALGGTGGVIVAAPDGSTAWSFTTPGMYRGSVESGGRRAIGLYGRGSEVT